MGRPLGTPARLLVGFVFIDVIRRDSILFSFATDG
jgi:hypothetical protein